MKPKTSLLISLCSVLVASASFGADVKRECVAASTDGQTSRDAGSLSKARDQFLVCSRDACPAVVRSSCSRWLAEVEQQIPSVVIRAADAANSDLTDGTATIDGTQFPLDGKPIPLDPGKHLVVVDAENGVHLEKKLLLGAGEKSRLIELRVEAPKPEPANKPSEAPAGAAPSSGIPTGAWVLGGVTVAALGSFGIFAFSAKHQLNQLNATCSPHCAPSDSDAGRRDALLADISLGVGVAAFAGALTWALLPGSKSAESAPKSALLIAPSPHGGYALLSTRF